VRQNVGNLAIERQPGSFELRNPICHGDNNSIEGFNVIS